MPRTYYHEEITRSGMNPYDAVLASSREARRLNQSRLSAGLAEGPEKVTTVALGRLVDGKVELVRDADPEKLDANPRPEENPSGR